MVDTNTYKALIYLEEDKADSFIDFLKHNEIDSACKEFDDELVSYAVYVLKEDEDKAIPLVKAFKENEIENALDCDNDSDNDFISTNAPSSVYENKSSKYNELRSSGIMLIIFTALGAIYMLLNMIGVLHLNSGFLFYTVFSLLLLVFLYGGINSLMSAKRIKNDAFNEADLTVKIDEWFNKNYNAKNIDEIINDNNSPDEVLFFKRVEKIKELISNEFDGLDNDFLEHLAEEYVEKLY